jgi:hypothetical protein
VSPSLCRHPRARRHPSACCTSTRPPQPAPPLPRRRGLSPTPATSPRFSQPAAASSHLPLDSASRWYAIMWQQNLGGYLQADVFDLVGLPMIENALAGFNTSLVYYGQLLLLIQVVCFMFSAPRFLMLY